jgi:hypothetical protein
MRSVADDLRALTHARVLRLPAAERMLLALTLGDEDLDLYARASGRSRADARQVLHIQRTHGRAPSCADAFDRPDRQ